MSRQQTARKWRLYKARSSCRFRCFSELGANKKNIQGLNMADASIFNLGELSKPATVLIEKISEAVGGIFKPFQIVRIAKAEAEAEKISADSQIQVSDLQRRAFYRFLEEEAKKQKNIEEITQKALYQLEETSEPKDIEDDWIASFFHECRLISDHEMQTLWSRILAGEANAPGSYSKRTVKFLASIDKSDAELFTRLCIFCWKIGDACPLIYDIQDEIYNRHGIDFDTLRHLESIGLVEFGYLTSFRRLALPKTLTVFYHGKPTVLRFQKDSDNEIDIGNVLFTKIGQELFPICGSQPDSEFEQYIRDKWKQLAYIKEEKTEQDGPADG